MNAELGGSGLAHPLFGMLERLDIEPRERFGGACTRHRGLGTDDGGLT